ncbi:SLC13 family permease [Comamonadaceae bacterium G21597-S1]|nr:SLC13 family permease [Comamonadaceae bacterium G21597-S1]
MNGFISDQSLILVILLLTVAMFLWGRWRHDMVAVGSLLACVLTGLLPATEAFAGFGHPAVISVACVLVLSRGLQLSGAVDALARHALPKNAGAMASMGALIGLGAVLSGFMNNVGAMALLMPVAIQLSKRLDMAPGQVLMPLAFGTILGGMTTLIGTPPNLIVAGFRAEAGLGSFGMFDFTPIGLAVAVAGVVFVVLLGWRLVPVRKQSGMEGFETGAYLTEARVKPGSKAEGQTLRELDRALDAAGAQVVGLVRNEVRVFAPNPGRRVREGDILVIEADAESLAEVLSSFGLKLEEAMRPPPAEEASADADAETETAAGNGPGPEGSAAIEAADAAAAETAAPKTARAAASRAAQAAVVASADPHGAAAADGDGEADGDADDKPADKPGASAEVVLMELAVLPGSLLDGRSASDIRLRTVYGLNLLALSRQGQRSMRRLRAMAIRPGDLLLMQGSPEAIAEFAADHGCVPLAARALRIPSPRKAWTAGAIMVCAVAAAALGLLPAAVSFALGVLASMALRTVPLRAVYEAIDWPVIVLLAALIPVAGAMETTGAADLIARFFLDNVAQGNAVIGLSLILVVTMFLSDLMNNAATAAVMCPIALGTAAALGASPDAFLMAVAIGASCAFLTPIGHQNNTLILGPGGFRFGDYWRLGLPLEALVAAVSIPMLLLIWPL